MINDKIKKDIYNYQFDVNYERERYNKWLRDRHKVPFKYSIINYENCQNHFEEVINYK
jgi:hypothetical protein